MLRFLAQKRGSLISLVLAALLALAPAIAEARMGGGGSFGSRGSRTWSAPPSTRTVPGMASPFERSDTPRSGFGMDRPGVNSPAFGGSSFGRGLLGGLAGGLLGAGLFGLLTGNGFFGGMGGFMSIIGFLLQIALVVFLARMAFAWWQRRNAPAGARSEGRELRPSPAAVPSAPVRAERAPVRWRVWPRRRRGAAAARDADQDRAGGLQRLRAPARRVAGRL